MLVRKREFHKFSVFLTPILNFLMSFELPEALEYPESQRWAKMHWLIWEFEKWQTFCCAMNFNV